MIVRRHIRIIHTILAFVSLAWYFLDGMDTHVHAIIINHPTTALAVLAAMWLTIYSAFGVWILTEKALIDQRE